jgi:hypothetical protein
MPILLFAAFGASLLLPQHMRPLAEVLVQNPMPIFLCAPLGASVCFPEQVGAFADELL